MNLMRNMRPLSDDAFTKRAQELKDMLKARKINQREFAEKIGISFSNFNKFLRGENRINSLITLSNICREAGLSMWYWYEVDPDKQVSDDIVLLPVYYSISAYLKGEYIGMWPASIDDYGIEGLVKEDRVFWVKALTDKWAPIVNKDYRLLVCTDTLDTLVPGKLYVMACKNRGDDTIKRYVPTEGRHVFAGICHGDNSTVLINPNEIDDKNLRFYRILHIGYEP